MSLNPFKFKVIADPTPETVWSSRIGKNSSWISSVKIAFTRILFNAPSIYVEHVGHPLRLLVHGIFSTITCMILATLYLIASFVAGLFGYLRMPTQTEVNEEAREINS